MNKLKRRILSGAAAAAMLLWNAAVLPQDTFPQIEEIEQPELSAKAINVADKPVAPVAKDYPSVTADNYLEYLSQTFKYGYKDTKTSTDFEIGGVFYTIINHEITITSDTQVMDKQIKDLYIPRPASKTTSGTRTNPNGQTVTIETFSVVKIDNGNLDVGLFEDNEYLESVFIPATVKDIDSRCFANCKNLKTVTFDKEFVLGPGSPFLKTIPAETFMGCESLESINLEALTDLEALGVRAFKDCKALKSITVPNKVETIWNETFRNCEGLTSATMDGAKLISTNAFDSCTSLATVSMESVTNIDNSAFINCTSLAITELPENLQRVGEYAFKNCTALAVKKLPASLKTIEHDSFMYSGIKGDKDGVLTLPDELQSVSSNAFAGCPNLKKLVIADSNPNYATVDGNLYRKAVNSETGEVTGGYLYTVPAGAKSTLSSLGDKVYMIWESAAEGAQFGNLTLDLDSLNYMAIWAFKNAKIDKLTITGSADATCQFDSCIFEGAQIGELVIDCSIKSQESQNQENFRYKTEFKNAKIGTVTITENVTSIPWGLFGYDPQNTYGWETVEEIEAKFPDIDTLYFNADQIEYDYVNPGTFSGVHHAVFGPNVKTIPFGMFKTNLGSSKLESVVIPEGVTRLSSNAFWNCTNLTEIDLPDSLEKIDSDVFRNTSIKSVYIPGNVKYLGHVFIDMPELEWVAVPNNFGDDTLSDLFWSQIGFKSTGENMSDIAPCDNTVTIYGVEGSAADCYVNGKTGDKNSLHSAGNVKFVAVPDLGVSYDDDPGYFKWKDPVFTFDSGNISEYEYTGEPITPALTHIDNFTELTDEQAATYKVTYSNNINPGYADVTISTRNPESGVGIGSSGFLIINPACIGEPNDSDMHSWSEWLSDETRCGHELRVCLVEGCTARQERENPDAHTWVEVGAAQNRTCTTDGIMLYKCSVCDATKKEPILSTGHTWKAITGTDADGNPTKEYVYEPVMYQTFNNDGYSSRVCELCGVHETDLDPNARYNVIQAYTKTPSNVEVKDITYDGATITLDPANTTVIVRVFLNDEQVGEDKVLQTGETSYQITGLTLGQEYTVKLIPYYNRGKIKTVYSDEPAEVTFFTAVPRITDLRVATYTEGIAPDVAETECIYTDGVKLAWTMPEGVDKAMIYATKKIGATFETLASLNDFVNNSPSNVIKLDGDQVALTVEGTAGEAVAADIAGLTPGTDYRFYVVPALSVTGGMGSARQLASLTPTTYINVTTKSVEITDAKISGVKPVSFNAQWVNPEGYKSRIWVLKDVVQDLDVRELWEEALESIDAEGRPRLYSEYLESNGYEDDTPDEREAFLQTFADQLDNMIAEHPEVEQMADAALYMMRRLLDLDANEPIISAHADNAVTVKDLEPGKLYTVIIAPATKAGDVLSPDNWLQMQVATPAEFAKITNLQVVKGTGDSIKATWDPVDGEPDDVYLDLVTGFPELEYMEGVSEDQLPKWDNDTMTDTLITGLKKATSYELTDLKPDTLYTVLVSTRNYDEEVNRYTVTQFTLPDPSKFEITNLKALVSKDKKSVDITSTVPLGAAGAAYFLFRKADLEGVELNTFEDIKGLTDGGLDLFRDMTADGKMTIALDSFDAEEFTLVALAAVDGNEPPLSAILTSIDISLNELPYISNLKVTDITSDSAKVTWDAADTKRTWIGLYTGFPEMEYAEGLTVTDLPESGAERVFDENIDKTVTEWQLDSTVLKPGTMYTVLLGVGDGEIITRYTLTQFTTPAVDVPTVTNLTAAVSEDNTAVAVSCKLPEGAGGALIAVFPTSAMKAVKTLDYGTLQKLQLDKLPMLSGTTPDGTLTLEGLTDKFGKELTVAAFVTSDPKNYPKDDAIAVCTNVELHEDATELVVSNLTAQLSEDGKTILVTCDVPAEAAGAQIFLFSAADVSGKTDVTYADIKALVDAGAAFKSELTADGKTSFEVTSDTAENLTVVAFARTDMKNPLPTDSKAVTRNITVTKPAETTVATTAETKATTAETKTTTAAETKATTAETKTTTAQTQSTTAAETKTTTAQTQSTTAAETKTTTVQTKMTTAQTKTTTAETKTTTAAQTDTTTAASKSTTTTETKTTTAEPKTTTVQTKTTTAEPKTTTAQTKTTTAEPKTTTAQTKTTTAEPKTTTAQTKTTTAEPKTTTAQTKTTTAETKTTTTQPKTTTVTTVATTVTTSANTSFTTVTTEATTVTTAPPVHTATETTVTTAASAAAATETTVTTAATTTPSVPAATETTITTAASAAAATETTVTTETTAASPVETATETSVTTEPLHTVVSGEATTTTQAQTETTPAQSGTAPVQTETTPAQSGTAPVQTETTPAQSETAPVQTETTPAQSGTAPVQTETKPVQSETAPVQTETTPAQSETAPAQTETTPAQTETTPTETTPSEESFLLGDVNADGTVNASDAAKVLIAAAKIGADVPSGLTDLQTKAADVNGDGIVNASDAALILQYAAYAGAVDPNITMVDYLKMRGLLK